MKTKKLIPKKLKKKNKNIARASDKDIAAGKAKRKGVNIARASDKDVAMSAARAADRKNPLSATRGR